jgi:hypothetical protein
VQLYVNRDVGGLSASTTNQAAKECAEVPAIKSIPSVFDLIKIDVDGAETIILNNLTNDQWLYAKAFVIECKADQIKEITSIVKGHRPDLVRHKTGNVDYIWL